MSEFEKVTTGLGEECGVFGAYDIYPDITLFAASWTSSCIWQNVEDRTGQMDFKIIHINYERNTADVAAYGGVFRTLLSVWNANFHRISYDSSTDWFCN